MLADFLNTLLEPFDLINGKRALFAALLIGFTNGYVSAYIVLKKSALKVGSLSHSLLPGIAFAILLVGLSQGSAFVGAAIAAMITGLGSLFISRSSRLDHDSSMAILFTTAFSAGVIVLHYLDVPGELDHWLFGNILGMSDADLRTVFIISAIALLFLTLFQRPIILTLFEPNVASSLRIPVQWINYAMFAILILVLISSLQAVGCILALGLLVAPAATIYLFSDSPRALFWGGGILGAVIAALALVVSYWADLPTGSTIVLLLGSCFLFAYLFSPKYGIASRFFKKPHSHQH